MKYLFLVLSIACSLQCLAQDPDPDLFRTWYLSFVQNSDNGFPYVVSEIDPPIYPYITILENLDYNGEGACNSFSGKFNLPFPDTLETIEYTNTSTDCGFQAHNSFENSYFWFEELTTWYEIKHVGNSLELTLGNGIFGIAIFKDYTLSSPDFYLNEIKIYPNPSSLHVFIKSHKDLITKIELYNLLGERIQSMNNNVESINISNLVSGIYLLKIYTEQGATVKKIIKK